MVYNNKDVREFPDLWWEYMDFLCDRIGFNKKIYYKLIKHLHSVPFKASRSSSRDINRIDDGLYQRRYFFRSKGLVGADFEALCSVFEMLCALSCRMSSDYLGYDVDGYENIDIIFMFFIKNLGLDRYDGELDPSDIAEIDEILDDFMDRNYDDDGVGSLFCIGRSVRGYKNMEIWEQMNVFLMKNDVNSIEDLKKFL